MKTHSAPHRISTCFPDSKSNTPTSNATVELPQPVIGQSITIARGPLTGTAGIFSGYRDGRWIVALPDCGPGVLAIIDPPFCDPIAE